MKGNCLIIIGCTGSFMPKPVLTSSALTQMGKAAHRVGIEIAGELGNVNCFTRSNYSSRNKDCLGNLSFLNP